MGGVWGGAGRGSPSECGVWGRWIQCLGRLVKGLEKGGAGAWDQRHVWLETCQEGVVSLQGAVQRAGQRQEQRSVPSGHFAWKSIPTPLGKQREPGRGRQSVSKRILRSPTSSHKAHPPPNRSFTPDGAGSCWKGVWRQQGGAQDPSTAWGRPVSPA